MSGFVKWFAVLLIIGAAVLGFRGLSVADEGGSCCCGQECHCEYCDCETGNDECQCSECCCGGECQKES